MKKGPLNPPPRVGDRLWVVSYGYWRHGEVLWVGPMNCMVKLMKPINYNPRFDLPGRKPKLPIIRVPWNCDGSHNYICRDRPPERVGKEWREEVAY